MPSAALLTRADGGVPRDHVRADAAGLELRLGSFFADLSFCLTFSGICHTQVHLLCWESPRCHHHQRMLPAPALFTGTDCRVAGDGVCFHTHGWQVSQQKQGILPLAAALQSADRRAAGHHGGLQPCLKQVAVQGNGSLPLPAFGTGTDGGIVRDDVS